LMYLKRFFIRKKLLWARRCFQWNAARPRRPWLEGLVPQGVVRLCNASGLTQ
jgi:hypothetical protein